MAECVPSHGELAVQGECTGRSHRYHHSDVGLKSKWAHRTFSALIFMAFRWLFSSRNYVVCVFRGSREATSKPYSNLLGLVQEIRCKRVWSNLQSAGTFRFGRPRASAEQHRESPRLSRSVHLRGAPFPIKYCPTQE
jgi:hypothetical protein